MTVVTKRRSRMMRALDVVADMLPKASHPNADPKLEAALRAACDDDGFRLPREVRITNIAGMAVLFHVSAYAECRAWKDESRTTIAPILLENARNIANKVEFHRNREKLKGRLEGDAPPWTRIVHPLALRLMMASTPDRSKLPMEWGRKPLGGGIADINYTQCGNGAIDVNTMMIKDDDGTTKLVFTSLPVGRGPSRVQVAIPTILPETVAMALAGRPLAHLVEFEKIGDRDVDDAVAALMIEGAETTTGGTTITLAPTKWIPYAPPPEKHLGWDDDAPYVA